MKTIFHTKVKPPQFLKHFLLVFIAAVGPYGNAQSSYVLVNSEWFIIDSNVNGTPISLEYSGGLFYAPAFEDFFQHYYGASCIESFKVNYTDVTETSFNLSTIFDYDACTYTDPDEIEAVELYQSFYFELPFDTNSTPKNPFTYEWVDSGFPVPDLVITNPDGDWLLYRTYHLSTPTFEESNFIVYPNPANDVLTIQAEVPIASVEIMNLLGQALLFTKGNGTTQQVDISGLSAGSYFVKVVAGEASSVLRIIKQ